jgi:hypothetical protein
MEEEGGGREMNGGGRRRKEEEGKRHGSYFSSPKIMIAGIEILRGLYTGMYCRISRWGQSIKC